MSKVGSAGNVIAAVCSFFWPGLGQLVQGRIIAAFLFFAFTGACYGVGAILFFPLFIALPLHLWSIVNAARYTRGD